MRNLCDSTACGQIPSGFLGQKYFEVTAIHKDIGWPGQPRAGATPRGGPPLSGKSAPSVGVAVHERDSFRSSNE